MPAIREIPTLTDARLAELLESYSKRLTAALGRIKQINDSGDKTWRRENRQEIDVCRSYISSICGEQRVRKASTEAANRELIRAQSESLNSAFIPLGCQQRDAIHEESTSLSLP